VKRSTILPAPKCRRFPSGHNDRGRAEIRANSLSALMRGHTWQNMGHVGVTQNLSGAPNTKLLRQLISWETSVPWHTFSDDGFEECMGHSTKHAFPQSRRTFQLVDWSYFVPGRNRAPIIKR